MARRKDRETVIARLKARFMRTFDRISRHDPPSASETLEHFRGSTIFPLTVDAQGNELSLIRASEGIPPVPPRGTPVTLAQVGEAIDRLASRPFTSAKS